jgi:Fe-S cluster assembly protein SufD
VVEPALHLLFVTVGEARMAHPRIVVLAGEHSQARVVESYAGVGDDASFTNVVTDVRLDAHAVLDHYKIQRESLRAFHVATMHVRAGRGCAFASHSLTFGGALVRNDVIATLAGEGTDCTLNGLYLATDRQLVDNHTTIDHATPHCGSHELYKGILGDRARGVFNGKIVVRPDAQKTDAKQTNKALILSDQALVNTKPQLEIFANDVRCTHGAAIGQLDEDALFYLRARGIGRDEARHMLIHAFAGEVLDGVRIAALRDRLDAILLARLPGDAG